MNKECTGCIQTRHVLEAEVRPKERKKWRTVDIKRVDESREREGRKAEYQSKVIKVTHKVLSF